MSDFNSTDIIENCPNVNNVEDEKTLESDNGGLALHQRVINDEGKISVESLFSNIKMDDIDLMIKPELLRSDKESANPYSREIAFDDGLPEGSENVSAWVTHDETDIMEMFSCLNAFKEGTDQVEWEKVDYEIYGEDWYREKYPNFPPEWYALLVQASREKFKDLTKDDTQFSKTDGNFTVKWD